MGGESGELRVASNELGWSGNSSLDTCVMICGEASARRAIAAGWRELAGDRRIWLGPSGGAASTEDTDEHSAPCARSRKSLSGREDSARLHYRVSAC